MGEVKEVLLNKSSTARAPLTGMQRFTTNTTQRLNVDVALATLTINSVGKAVDSDYCSPNQTLENELRDVRSAAQTHLDSTAGLSGANLSNVQEQFNQGDYAW